MKKIILFLMVFATCVAIEPQIAVAQEPKQRIICVSLPKKLALSDIQNKAKRMALAKVQKLGWGNHEWNSLLELWTRESQWNPASKNKKSSAYGIPQMLKMPVGTPMETQIDLGLKYIIHRYETPSKALRFHKRVGWY